MSGRDAEYYSAFTPYPEANALCAIMAGDFDAAMDLLEDLAPHELKRLIEQSDRLGDLADQVIRGKSSR
jgi:hypothetical protein